MSAVRNFRCFVLLLSLYPAVALLMLLLVPPPQANAFVISGAKKVVATIAKLFKSPKALPDSAAAIAKLSKSAKTLPNDEIIRLSKLSDEVNGTVKVGKELGKLNLPNDVLEDTFMRIAIHQRKVTRTKAEGMFARLGGTPGFRSTLRKIIGNNAAVTNGHLNELRIADSASMSGFKVLGIGEKFTDGLKRAPTDIDVVLERGGKRFAIEAKNYAPTRQIPIDKYRADLDTLVEYRKTNQQQVIPIFAMTNKPDGRYSKILENEANKRGVELIFGNPQGLVEQMKILAEIA